MYFMSLKTNVYKPQYSSWNKSVGHLFPYKTLEKESERLAMLFQQDEKSVLKQRELNILDILRIVPNATRKLKKGFPEYDYVDDGVWPLPSLDGCPKVSNNVSNLGPNDSLKCLLGRGVDNRISWTSGHNDDTILNIICSGQKGHKICFSSSRIGDTIETVI